VTLVLAIKPLPMQRSIDHSQMPLIFWQRIH
jgi:hypothetical protein